MKTIALPPLLGWLQPLEFPRKLGICERFFGQRLSTHGICWVETAAGIPWKLDLGNATHRWIVYGKYEGAGFFKWAQRFLPRDAVIVDSGANIGQVLLYLGQMVTCGRILAFEPGQHPADWLAECLAENPQLPVDLIRAGLGEAPVAAFLEERGSADRHGSWNQISFTGGQPTPIVTLSEILRARGISSVALWKLDVEGFEIPALKGAAEFLSEHRIQALWVELSGENGFRTRAYLESLKYCCCIVDKAGQTRHASQLPDHTNALFLPK